MKRICIIFSVMILQVVATNISAEIDKPLSQHPLHKGWLCHSLIGILRIILNSLVIIILYLERGSLVSSVNVMIMSEHFFKNHKQFSYQYSGLLLYSDFFDAFSYNGEFSVSCWIQILSLDLA